jgi:hypothetical protein
MGPVLATGVYVLLALHAYVFFAYMLSPLDRKLGSSLKAVLWLGIGLILGFNISFNHLFAMVIKPGSVEDI